MKIKGFILDLDGTIYLGEKLVPGAREAVEWMRARGRVAFLTNKPIDAPVCYAEKLTRLGIPTEPYDVLTSVATTVDHLCAKFPGGRFHLVGEEYLRGQLVQAGMQVAATPDQTELVVLSLDRTLDYGKLHHAYLAAKSGARVYATNPDLVCPTDTGDIIDAGASIAVIEALTRRPIDGVFGKPSRAMAGAARTRTRTLPDETIVVGDRVETDIAMGLEAGMRTALVLSGATQQGAEERGGYRPDFVVPSIRELPRVLEEQ